MTIKLIATDLDGTLLNSQHELSLRNAMILQAAREKGVKIVIATGKTPASTRALVERLELDTPGIYNQGLLTVEPDGSIRRQTTLPSAIARQVITFAEDRGFTVVAYRGSEILTRKRNNDTALLEEYGEPAVREVGPLQNILDTPVNKIIAIHRADARRIKALRWHLSVQLNGSSHLVQPGLDVMLEVLPRGASKGTALKALLADLKIAPEHVLALGDGDNDIEMIEQAGIGIAVANASQALKDKADHIVGSNDDDGVAEAIEHFVLETKAVEDNKST